MEFRDVWGALWAVFCGYDEKADLSYTYYVYVGDQFEGEHSFTFVPNIPKGVH